MVKLTATRRRSRWVHAMPYLLVAGLVGACSDDGTSNGTETSSAGADLYAQTCASCHGDDLRGTDQGPSHLSQVYAPDHHPDATFRMAIRQGTPAHHWDFGDMPPIEGLNDDEVELLIAYIREQQEIHGFEPYPPP
ncbi:MAG: cytochrome c [Acidimicrobiia bacterium]|nr:cytochrome c [Acidimicrobiia bacterium]